MIELKQLFPTAIKNPLFENQYVDNPDFFRIVVFN